LPDTRQLGTVTAAELDRAEEELDETRIHDVLSNERRRLVIELLQGCDDGLTVRELSERIAAVESGESPPPSALRRSVYVSLQQTHVPKLDRLDVVAFDEEAKTVSLRPEASQVDVYMEVVPQYGISWGEYDLGVAVLGLLATLASVVGTPLFARVPPAHWAALFLLIVAASAVYRVHRQPRSVLERLRDR
jgi:hypothetical protein